MTSAIHVIPRTLGLLAVFAMAAATARRAGPAGSPDVRPGGGVQPGRHRRRR